ncbi:MAG: amidohydrolase family protein [Gemmatimonadota bacterium]|nr:MAG: amidohydrolase family protein [Gemmatimonadota bacterium]
MSTYTKKASGILSRLCARTLGSPLVPSLVIVVGLAAAGVKQAAAQHDPRIAPASAYVIRGATVHTLAGDAIANGVLVLSHGVIQEVGTDVAVPAGATVVDASGLHVYPGMIDAFSRLGLTEIGSVSATEDVAELGSWNPHLRAYEAIYPASEHIPVARANGVTHAVSAPGSGGGFRGGGAGGIPGQAALIHLDGWTVEEMSITPSAAMVIQWPTIRTRSFDFATFQVTERPYTEAKKEYDEQLQEMESWLEAARHYKQAVERGDPAKFNRDLQLEHLARTLGGELPVIVVANDKRGIESALDFAQRYDLRLILAGARDAREVKEQLAEKGIPVILGPSQSLPAEEDDSYYLPFSLAGELQAAGVTIAFATFNSSDSRTLPYEAANTVAFGLPHDEALKAVTLNAAEILGVADRLGTIEPGKLGNLIVTDGDPLEIQTQVNYVFIRGIPVDTENRHRRLWERYQERPGPAEQVPTGATAQTRQ